MDALNVAYWCGSPPTLRLPLGLAIGLLGQGYRVGLIFDASARYQMPASEHAVYGQLLQYPALALQVPSGSSADRQLLTQAKTLQAAVISRDRFRQHRPKFRSIVGSPTRSLSGGVLGDQIHLPQLGFSGLLPADIEQAWAAWRALGTRLERQGALDSRCADRA
ncbi:MAG: hypothetical protein ABF271_11055 [Abyssibacter sp.]|uniref:hypothetical protein n=1 Tax=Abyssibacter sp. TaxID=2320200 RepID=UPI00321B1E29